MSNKNIDEYNRMKLYEPLMPKVIGKVELTDEDKRLAKIVRGKIGMINCLWLEKSHKSNTMSWKKIGNRCQHAYAEMIQDEYCDNRLKCRTQKITADLHFLWKD